MNAALVAEFTLVLPSVRKSYCQWPLPLKPFPFWGLASFCLSNAPVVTFMSTKEGKQKMFAIADTSKMDRFIEVQLIWCHTMMISCSFTYLSLIYLFTFKKCIMCMKYIIYEIHPLLSNISRFCIILCKIILVLQKNLCLWTGLKDLVNSCCEACT